MSQLVTLQYNDQFSVDFTNDAWFNATIVAKNFGKLPNEWLRLESTQDYIQELTNFLLRDNPAIKSEDFSLLKTQRGKTGGSWFHPKLAIAFARWLDVKFSIWCDMQIEKLLHPVPYGLKETAPTFASIEMQRHVQEMVHARAAAIGKHYNTIYDKIKTQFEFPRLANLPVTKYLPICDWFGEKPKYKMPEFVTMPVEELELLRNQKPIVKFAVTPLEEGEMSLPETRYLELVQAEQKLKFVEGELLEKPKQRPENQLTYHEWIDIVNQMEAASFRVVSKKTFIALHEALAKVMVEIA